MGRKTRQMRVLQVGKLALYVAVALCVAGAPARSQDAPTVPETCAKTEFESAVDHAAEVLRDLNNKNRPVFQAKLRQLKEKRAWNDSQFLKEAEPFVRDEQITIFDGKTNDLLSSISSLGREGANAPEPNCTMLSELRARMQELIETQTQKWAYMFQKIDGAIAQ